MERRYRSERRRGRRDCARSSASAFASSPFVHDRRRCVRPWSPVTTSSSSCRPAPASRSCYQLPGLARGGTTLVVSPLIALMEDQVAKLRELGLARRTHPLGPGPGRVARRLPRLPRRASSTTSSSPPSGSGFRAFPRCSPNEASPSWPSTRPTASPSGGTTSGPTTGCSGSGSRLLRPAPIIALTATATPRVQVDIAAAARPRRAEAVHPRLPSNEHRHRGGRRQAGGDARTGGARAPA